MRIRVRLNGMPTNSAPSPDLLSALPSGLDPAWLGPVLTPQSAAALPDPAGALAAALAQPTGAPRLRELVRPGQTIAVLVDDVTRKTPAVQILPHVLAELAAAGAGPDTVRIVVALGTHRPLSEAELAGKLGRAVLQRYRVVNTACTEAGAFVDLGTTEQGLPISLLRAVAEADLRIGVGMITPHLDAGFSGGAKIVLPGVCGLATVDAFHKASAFDDANHLGNPEAPLRRMLEAFVQRHAPLHFIVNVVLNEEGQLAAVAAGHAVLAQRQGVEAARAVYGAPFDRRYPVVVAAATPYDQDLWQSIKGAWAGDLVTADGGTLILATAAPEGNSLYPLVPAYAGQDPVQLRARIAAGQVEDAMQAATGVLWSRITRRVRLVLVSPGLEPATAAAMHAGYAESVDAAITAAVGRLPAAERAGAVARLPLAGLTLPLCAPPRN